MNNIWRIIQFIPEYRGRVLGVIAVGTALGFIGTATPYLYKFIVDAIAQMLSGAISREQATWSVTLLLATFFVLRLGVVLFGALQNRQADNLWLDTVSTLRQRVFDNMTRKSIDYFEKTRAGEIMDRFGNITTITMWLSSLTDGTLASLLQLAFILVVLLLKAPLVGVIAAAVVLLNLWISWRTVGWTRPYRRGWQVLAGRMTGLLAEMIGNISTVRSFGGEPAVKQRYDDTQAEWMVVRGNLHKTEWRSEQALNMINTFGVFAAVALTVHGALQGRFTVGDILLVLTLTQNLVNTVGPVARQINQAGEIESTAERLVELLDVEAEHADRPDAVALEHLESIVFEDVSFRYPGKDHYALHHVSFRLDAGRTLALVGSSGSGKSTIVKLLMRFYDPSEGRILINGRDLRDYRQRSVRALMGVVLQDVALFNDSIGENIAFARPGANHDEVRAAARAAHAEGFILRMENGYDTLVGERGVKLSGGEKQRVAIARAILKDPGLIILDEATSALDSESEHLVQKGLERLVSGRTSVIIAHRLSTVMSADLILVLNQGEVLEQGRHAELVERPGGFYAHLFSLQTRGHLVVEGV
ncbi:MULTISPECIES: ABC transporter ATP-binding protein [unclassified Pseudomonas]|uniref:ABC transporter ATP-binding protein n=1 Tax=unclassified Pseudomonas TaxID=196821 RepID=UPI00244A05C6|nr:MULTISPECIES: ABC transporter ATP-binding protein [unclassified Pseudomonas]MDH0897548.1 ABC transporter ATP-binding protein/permease [Pseudomonas sp. GD03875]MDH1067354.1 ABC transporter ATP-binding protein/permease [Pseudomonas sp. GD03985]